MANEIKSVNGKIILEEKKFNRIVTKFVMKNNDSSGKITLPKDLIGKKVLVCWEEVKKDGQ
jgi:putative transposon-encoded protein